MQTPHSSLAPLGIQTVVLRTPQAGAEHANATQKRPAPTFIQQKQLSSTLRATINVPSGKVNT